MPFILTEKCNETKCGNVLTNFFSTIRKTLYLINNSFGFASLQINKKLLLTANASFKALLLNK